MGRILIFIVSLSLSTFVWASNCNNGVYISTNWLTMAKRDKDISALAKRLQQSSITNVYISTNGVTPDNTVARSFLSRLKDDMPNAKVIGMISKRPCAAGMANTSKCFDMTADKDRFFNAVSGLWRMGFDGIQLDFEPVPNPKDHCPPNVSNCNVVSNEFLTILDKLKASKPKGKIISVAGYFLDMKGQQKISPSVPAGQSLLSWNRTYYSSVMSRADQVMVMDYDTALKKATDYSQFTAWQVQNLKELASETHTDLQIGLPADNMKGRKGLYDRSAENLKTGMLGVQKGLGAASCISNVGVSIYDDEGMTDDQWKSFNDIFSNSPSQTLAPKN